MARDRGLVFDWNARIDESTTRSVRDLQVWSEIRTSLFVLEISLVNSLSILPVDLGGTVAKVDGGYAALPEHLRADLPMVRALMIVRGHPCHPGFVELSLERPEQPPSFPKVDIAPLLESIFVADPQPWSLARFNATLLAGAIEYCQDADFEPDWTPDMIYPGSHVSRYMSPIAEAIIMDEFGAFDPSFTRRDALVGEWWLLQPVSPRLSHHHLALKFGLRYVGILPANHVDAAGRVVIACFPSQEMSDGHRISLIEDSKFVAGYKKVLWSKTTPPLDDPSFDLVQIEGVTEDSYGPYLHSSELPPWPGSDARESA
ncbi:MAG: hypothetical protein ABJE66_37615 [Deltaproteobacteria bacterium]